MLNDLLLLSGNDIPFLEAQVNIHQPSIKEIAYIGEESFFIGLALSNSSNYDSSICVLDRDSNIVLLDKFYFGQDIDYFFESSPYISNSVICTSVTYDNKMLDGKWRIHAKNYQSLQTFITFLVQINS